MYVILEFCAEMTLQSYPALWSPAWYGHLIIIDGALSIQPKILEFRLEIKMEQTINFWFGSTGIFGTTFEVGPLLPVQLSWSVGLKCPFSLDIIVVSSSTLLRPAYKNNNQMHLGFGRVCSARMYCSIEQVEFVKFQSGILIEWQAPTICFVPG